MSLSFPSLAFYHFWLKSCGLKRTWINNFSAGKFKRFTTKQPVNTWLCVGTTPASKALESCSNAQKTWQVL